MKKSVISSCEELKVQLFELDTIVNMFERKNPKVISLWKNWLIETEKILKKYNFSEMAELAGLRSQMLIEEEITNKKMNRRKLILQQSLKTVNPAQHIVLLVQKQLEEKIENARIIITQIILAAKQANAIKPIDDTTSFTVYIDTVLNQLLKNEQIQPRINTIIATIGRFDVLRIFADEILKE